MIPGLAWMSDELAMALTCILCLVTGMMIGTCMTLSRDEDNDDAGHDDHDAQQ